MCFAGKPQPMVRWLINGRVKDEEYENNAGDVIENRYDDFFDIFPQIFVHIILHGESLSLAD